MFEQTPSPHFCHKVEEGEGGLILGAYGIHMGSFPTNREHEHSAASECGCTFYVAKPACNNCC